MRHANSYKILQLKIDDIFRYSVTEKNQTTEEKHLVIKDSAFRNLLFSMLSSEKKAVTDTTKLTTENIASTASIAIPYSAILRLIYLIREKDGKNRISDSFAGPPDGRYYLKTILYIDLNTKLKGTISQDWKKQLYNGLTVCFGNEEINFVLFERSASQQRQNILVMADKEIYGDDDNSDSDLKKCIRCGIDDTAKDFKVIPSKYSAYRALLLTSGIAVDTRDDNLSEKNKLNKESVMVVDDYTLKDWFELRKKYQNYNITDDCYKTSCETAEISGDSHKITYKKEDDISLQNEKLFDGEGLVSVEFGNFIAENITESGSAEKISSFQVRMPFVKGVLHKVDFHKMLEEIFDTETENIYINDAFGNKHKASDVKIILTKSMFKMFDIYKDSNGWETYWNAFYKGEHCLIISNTDEMFASAPDFTISNYQFLSTLEEKNDDNRLSLVSPSVNALYTVINSTDSLAVSTIMLERSLPDDIELKTENADSTTDDENMNQKITDAMLIARCPDIVNIPAFRNSLSYETLAKNFSYGHLIENGIMRFLSGDLMQFFCFLADRSYIENCKNDSVREKLKEFINEAVLDNEAVPDDEPIHYYTPDYDTKKAVIDRNPHLTRNEHVIASPMKKSKKRTEYFGHLKGVVMIQVDKQCALQRLGGADFDGDIARLFFDPAYIASAMCSKDKLPLMIPSGGAKPEKTAYNKEAKLTLIERTSKNKVGLFSNYAFRTSLFAYGSRTVDGKTDKMKQASEELVLLSCATGLEIDSVKTGWKPDLKNSDLLIYEKYPMMTSGGPNDPSRLMYFLGYKEYIKKDSEKKYMLTPPDKETGHFSLVENLPYIFLPNKLYVNINYKAEKWAENCHNLLYSSVEKEKDNKKERVFSYVKDQFVRKSYSVRSLSSLLPDFPEKNNVPSKLFVDAYFAVRAYLFSSTRKGNAEINRKFDIVRRILIQRYGNYSGTMIADTFAEHQKCFGNASQVSHILFNLIEWKNLQFAEMRKSRFISLAEKNSIELSNDLIDAFDEICCKFSSGDPDSMNLAYILLSNKYKSLPSLSGKNKFLKFESDIDVSTIQDKKDVCSLLQKCFHSINYSFYLKELSNAIKHEENLTIERLIELCQIYQVELPCTHNPDDSVSYRLTEKFFKLYGNNPENLTIELKKILTTEFPAELRIVKSVLNRIFENQKGKNKLSMEMLFKSELKKDDSELKENCRKIESLWQKLHLSDQSATVNHDDRLREIAEALYQKPSVNWLTKTNAEKRKKRFNELFKEAKDMKVKTNCMEPLPDELVSIISDPENYQLLPALLDYFRSTADTMIKRINIKDFNEKSRLLVGKYLYNSDTTKPSAGNNIEDTLSNLTTDFVNKFSADLNIRTENTEKAGYITPVADFSEFRECISEWRENSFDYATVSKDEIIIGDKSISAVAGVFYCIIRTAISLHPDEKLHGDAVSKILLKSALNANNNEATDEDVLYEIVKYSEYCKEKKSHDIPVDDPLSVDKFIVKYMKKPLYDFISRKKSIESVSGFIPDLNCGFLDGRQCASIKILCNNEELKESGFSMPSGSSIEISVNTIIDKDNNNNKSIEDRVKEGIKVTFNGFDTEPEYSIDFDDENYKFRGKILWLYAIPFKISICNNGNKKDIAECAVTHLRLPHDDKGNISEGYKDIAGETITATAIISDDKKSSKEKTSTEFKPLETFIWGYRKFRRCKTDVEKGKIKL